MPPTVRATFRKNERLHGRDAIAEVIRAGRAINEPPIRLVGLLNTATDDTATLCVAFAVPKRHLKQARHRNRVRRLMRECFRLNKQPWRERLKAAGKRGDWLIIYGSAEILPYTEVRDRLLRVVERWMEKNLPAPAAGNVLP
jgi:ribonuclease P protein component